MTRTLEAKILDSTHLELSEPIPGPPGQSIAIAISVDDEDPDLEAECRPPAPENVRQDTALAAPHRTRELAWRRDHGDILDRYAGQWVVLEGEEIVAHGDDPVEVVGEARSQGIQVPYVFYVEEFRPDVVKMGL